MNQRKRVRTAHFKSVLSHQAQIRCAELRLLIMRSPFCTVWTRTADGVERGRDYVYGIPFWNNALPLGGIDRLRDSSK